MRAAQLRSLCVLTRHFVYRVCAQNLGYITAQAPPLQTGKGTLEPPKTTQQAEKSRHAAGFAVAAAVCPNRALASSDAQADS